MRIKNIHYSWLIAATSIGLLVGTFLALYSIRFTGIEMAIIAVCFGAIGLMRRNFTAVVLLFSAGLLFGLWRGGNVLVAQNDFDILFGQSVELVGRATEDPSIATDGSVRLHLADIRIDNKNFVGTVWVSTTTQSSIKRSDYVLVSGQLSEGFGNIPAAMYRARIISVERRDYADVARDVRDSFADGIRTSIQEPEASLGAGFLVGQKTALPEKLDNELRLLGLTHIVVASGYNLTILVRFARRFFARISRFSALALSGGLVYCFALVTGFSPSMSRASLITGLSLIAWYYGRKFHPIVLVSFSAAVTVILQPAYIWGDIGWLLSFASFIGVIMLAPMLQNYFWGDKKPGNIRQVFIETLSAQILTLPLIAYIFAQYSPLALIANVAILPLIPLTMFLTFFAGLAGMMFPATIAEVVGWPAEIVMRYMTYVVDRLAVLPLAVSEIEFSMTMLIVGYLCIFTMMLFLWKRNDYQFRGYNVIE